MSESIILPTARDEAWRYSDLAAIKGIEPATFEGWHDITVPPGESHCEHFALLDEGKGEGGVQLHRLRVRVGEGARCSLFGVVGGGRLGRVEIVVQLGRAAHLELGAVTLGGTGTTREIVTRVAHEAPEATSNQTVRSVHWGRGTGNFLGRIDVVRDAQRTDAGQSFKGLLLGRGAAINAVPQLEIFADDVKCAHGASVGQLDEAARFYMAARGIAPPEAEALLVRAFLADAFAACENEEGRDELLGQALGVLEGRP